MNDLDRRIQEALGSTTHDDSITREPNIAEELIGAFRGRHRWLHGLAFVFTFVFFALALWGGIRFYAAETMHEQLQWGGVCLLGVLCVAFLKLYFWMEMHTNRIMRELKRVELLVLQRGGPSPQP